MRNSNYSTKQFALNLRTKQGTRYALLCAALLLGLYFQVKLEAQETVTQFFNRAESAYNSVSSYSADWRITINDRTSKAKAYYRSPGNLLLDYSEPSKRFILITEKELVIYNRANNILMRQALDEPVSTGPPSLSLMRRLYSMRFKYPSGSEPRRVEGINEPVIVLLLTPINSAARLEELEVSFYADSLLMRRIKGTWYGSNVEYDFTNIHTNVSFDDQLFAVPDPSGSKKWNNFLTD